MPKKIKFGLIDKKVKRMAPFPLVASDGSPYELLVDTSKYAEANEVHIYARRADGEIVCDRMDINCGALCYTLKQSMYSVPGELSVRLVLGNGDDSVLTATEMNFQVLEGSFEGTVAENFETVESYFERIEEVESIIEDKADVENVYTKAEVDAVVAGAEAKADNAQNTADDAVAQLDTKADKENVYTKSEVDTSLDTKADKQTEYGGFEAGGGRTMLNSVVIGENTTVNDGDIVAIGPNAHGGFYGCVVIGKDATDSIGGGVAIGRLASSDGMMSVALGTEAVSKEYLDPVTWDIIGGIQLGKGTNEDGSMLQVYDKKLLDLNGNIPKERLIAALTELGLITN